MTGKGPKRRSPRLAEYDYSRPGAYFVTTCTYQRAHLFGQVAGGVMHFNRAGQAVREAWHELRERYAEVTLDQFVVMPNHIHGLLWLAQEPRAECADASSIWACISLSGAMRAFKSVAAISVNQVLGRSGVPVWQRSFYDHIVRSEEALYHIRRYIVENPERWELDPYHPTPTGPDPRAAQILQLLRG